jgi:hypothetical protein
MRKEEENGSQVMAAWYESTFELRHVFGATLECNSTLNQFIEKCIHVGGVTRNRRLARLASISGGFVPLCRLEVLPSFSQNSACLWTAACSTGNALEVPRRSPVS